MIRLHDKEYEFVSIVWENEPIQSGELTKICFSKLGWKRTTTYTVLKKMIDKGVLSNQNAIVTSLVKKEEVQLYESQRFMEKLFDNSLPNFLTTFMSHQKLTKEEMIELKKIIEEYEENQDE